MPTKTPLADAIEVATQKRLDQPEHPLSLISAW